VEEGGRREACDLDGREIFDVGVYDRKAGEVRAKKWLTIPGWGERECRVPEQRTEHGNT
jgi:hypothetical protein